MSEIVDSSFKANMFAPSMLVAMKLYISVSLYLSCQYLKGLVVVFKATLNIELLGGKTGKL